MKKIMITAFILVSVLTAPLFMSRDFVGNAGDLHLHYYPLKHYISTRIISGELPLWNPYIFCGTPCLANPQGGSFYPGSLLFYFLSNNISFAFKLWIWLHLIFMLVGFYALIRRFVPDDIPSFAGAVAVVFSSFVIYMVPSGHAVRLAGYAWFPLCGILFLEMCKNLLSDNFIPEDEEKKSGLKNLSRSSIHLISLSALAFSFAFLSGHPQGVFTAGIFAFAVALMSIAGNISFERNVAGNRPLLIGIAMWLALVFMFSFAQYLPSLEFSNLAENVSWRPLAKAYSLKADDFLSLILPWRWGFPSVTQGGGINSSADKLTISVSVFFEKKNMFIGYLALAFAVYGLWQAIKKYLFPVSRNLNGQAWDKNSAGLLFADCLFGIIFAAGLFLSLGFSLPGYAFIYDNLPLALGYFRTPSRFYFLTVVASGYFSARGVSFFMRHISVGKMRTAAGLAVLIAIFAELFLWNKKFIYTMPLNYSGRLPVEISSAGTDRVFTSDKIPANISMMNRIPNVNGYDALILKDFFRTFYSFYEPAQYRPSTFLAPSDDKEILTRDFPGWGMRYFITTSSGEKTDGFKIAARVGDVVVYQKKFWTPKFFAPPRVENLTHRGFVSFFPTKINPVTEAVYIRGINNETGYYNGLGIALKDYSSFSCGEKITMTARISSGHAEKEDTLLVMGDVFYPGWRAWIDGKETHIERASRVFRAINFDKSGDDIKINIAFMPFSVTLGVIVSALSSLFLILLIGLNIKRTDPV